MPSGLSHFGAQPRISFLAFGSQKRQRCAEPSIWIRLLTGELFGGESVSDLNIASTSTIRIRYMMEYFIP